jgi:hypothetical protein
MASPGSNIIASARAARDLSPVNDTIIDDVMAIRYHCCMEVHMPYKTKMLQIRDRDGDLRDKLKAITLKGVYGPTQSEVVRRLVDGLYIELYGSQDPRAVLREKATRGEDS